jgi:hypothetical protein
MNPRPPENHQVISCKFGGGREKGVRELRLGSDLMTTPNRYGAPRTECDGTASSRMTPHPAVRGHSTDPVVLIADGLGCRETA